MSDYTKSARPAGFKQTVAFAACLVLGVYFLEEISAFFVIATERLAESPTANQSLAVLFTIVGFVGAFVCLQQRATHRVRLVLITYLLAAVGLAGLYALIYYAHDDCFIFAGAIEARITVFDFLYFSFVSITTLGYGDIVPNHPFVRMLVIGHILFGGYLILRCSGEHMAPGTPCDTTRRADDA
jgi:uncharacterized membrane protein